MHHARTRPSRDAQKAQAFYGEVLGWKVQSAVLAVMKALLPTEKQA